MNDNGSKGMQRDEGFIFNFSLVGFTRTGSFTFGGAFDSHIALHTTVTVLKSFSDKIVIYAYNAYIVDVPLSHLNAAKICLKRKGNVNCVPN